MAEQFPYYNHVDFDEETNKKINMEIMKYAGMYILKKMSLSPDEGGYIFEVPLSGIDEQLEPVLDDIMFHDLIEIDAVNTRYRLTQKGHQYINQLITEAEGYIEKYQDFEPTTRVNLMKKHKVNPLRARFLWGLYDGEFDDFDKWQEDNDIHYSMRESYWQMIITKKEFYDMLFEAINNMDTLDDDSLDQVFREAEAERQAEKEKRMESISITRVDGDGSHSPSMNRQGGDTTMTHYYYHDPYYFNPVYDPFFWYVVF